MRIYDYQGAHDFIEAHKESIENASLGMHEDWRWTGDTVFENGRFTKDLLNKPDIQGIDGSFWATPVLVVEFKDGRSETFDCWVGKQDKSNSGFDLSGVLSGPVNRARSTIMPKKLPSEQK